MKEKRKLSNEGFSLVELIFVIAIMAILVGVLAPQYMKYLDKSRKATDIQAAQTLASAVNAALVDGLANDAVVSNTSFTMTELVAGTGTSFTKADAFSVELRSILGITKAGTNTGLVPKYKTGTYKDFKVTITVSGTSKTVEIFTTSSTATGSGTTDTSLYPTIDNIYSDAPTTTAPTS